MSQKSNTQLWKLAVATGGVARAIAIVAILIQVPIAAKFLTKVEFGFWSMLVATFQVLSLADLGLGLGIQNRITIESARDNSFGIDAVLKSGIRLLTAVCLGFLITLFITLEIVDVKKWLNVPSSASSIVDFGDVIRLVALPFLASLPLSLYNRYFIAVKKIWITNLLQAAASTISLASLYLVSRFEGSKGSFFLATSLAVWLPNILAYATYSLLRRSSTVNVDFKIETSSPRAWQILREGSGFLIPQVIAAVLAFAPPAIISKILGVDNVVEYNLCNRILSVLITIQSLPMAPLWAIYADSYARNDYRSLVATFKKSWLTSLLYSGASSIGMAVLGRYIIAEWTGIKLPVEFQSLLNIFAVYVFFYLIVTPLGVFLNGLGKTKSQAIGGPLMLIAFLLLSPTTTRHFGVNGTVAALLISCGFFGWIWFAFDVHAIIKGLNVERNSSKA